MQPISVITINYNNAAGLEQTMRSVLEQDYPALEYIVIDGGSDDGSVDLVTGNKQRLAYFVSEKDNGIYHAMNKGIEKATGDYLLFLNSGDRLIHKSILSDVFKTGHTAGIVYGNLQTEKGIITYPHEPDFLFFFRDSIGHPSSFIKKELFRVHGLYNENNRIVSDWEFFLKVIIRENVPLLYFNKVIAWYDLEGVSNNLANVKLQLAERAAVLKDYFDEYYPVLLAHLELQDKQLHTFKNSRAIRLLQRVMNSSVYKILSGKKAN